MKNFYSIHQIFAAFILAFGCSSSVWAQTYASIPYTTGFESGNLDASWTATSSMAGTNIEVIPTGTLTWTTQTAYAYSGNFFLGMDYGTGGTYNLNQANLHLNTAGESALRLQFWWAEWNDETEAQDGVYISDNGGVTFTKIRDLNGASYSDLTWTHFNMSLDSVNSLYGLSFTSTYIVRFQQYDNYYFAGGNDGFLFDNIEVSTTCGAPTFGSIGPVACVSYTVPSGDETYTNSGFYYDTIPNAVGCDSIIGINLVVLPGFATTTTVNACDSYTSDGGVSYSSSGTYTELYQTINGCDSTVTINLTLSSSTSSSAVVSACDSYISPAGGTYFVSGIYTDYISNAAGCDSIITTDLTINSSTSASIGPVALDSYTAPSGAIYTSSGLYIDIIPNAAGCDSVITINLVVNYTNLDENGQELIHVYPNPTSELLYIEGLESIQGIESMLVYDVNGRMVGEIEIGATEYSAATLETGVYYLVVAYDRGNSRIPFVKN